MRSEERLERLLSAWRAESMRPARPEPRDRARAAMHAALSAPAGQPQAWRPLLLRRRGLARRPLLAAAALVVAAAAVLGVLGWNAPAGSPLFGVRAARQSVQLALPGADAAALHLAFAEADLGDANRGINPAASLADARAELAAARTVLPSDRSSPLWTQYGDDLASLSTAEREVERGDRSTPGPLPSASAGARETPENTAPSTETPPSSAPAGEGTSGEGGGDGGEGAGSGG